MISTLTAVYLAIVVNGELSVAPMESWQDCHEAVVNIQIMQTYPNARVGCLPAEIVNRLMQTGYADPPPG